MSDTKTLEFKGNLDVAEIALLPHISALQGQIADLHAHARYTDMEVIVTDKRLYDYGLPAHATAHSAGLDLRAFWPPGRDDRDKVLNPGDQVMLDSGLRVWIKTPGYVGLLFPRSSSGISGLVLGNGTGVIDADYQGPLKLCLLNRSERPLHITDGERVAQMVILPCAIGYNINVVDDFSDDTVRGQGGFGSTGKS